MELSTLNNLPDNVKKLLIEAGLEIAVGDMFIDINRCDKVIRISKIEDYEGKILFGSETPKYWDASEWTYYSSLDISDLKRSYIKLTKSYAEYKQEADDVITGKITIDELSVKETQSDNQETSLISKSSKEGLIAIQQDMELKKSRVELIKAFVSLEMERRRQELNKITRQLEGVLTVFKKQIERIMRVITTIELYLGIDEEIIQIQDGEKAPVDTPITFRQRVLYMDEEIADTKNDGLDYRDVDKFDGWLMENQNYKKLLPETKGILVFRPRRNMKNYTDNSFVNSAMNLNNKQTYLLIRNGDCLFRIYTDKLVIAPRLFPKRTELMDLLKEIDKSKGSYSEEKSKEQVEDLMDQYKKRAVLLQGLIDRTEILHPMPQNLSIFKMDEAGDMFNFIYDDDLALPDGRLPFWEWHKEINKKIQRGSRVVVTSMNMDEDRLFYYSIGNNIPDAPSLGLYEIDSKFEDKTKDLPHYTIDELESKGLIIKRGHEMVQRYSKEYSNKSYYDQGHYLPLNDSIEIKTFKKDNLVYIESYNCTFKQEQLFIRYKPNGEVYTNWGSDSRERTNRVSYKIAKTERCILNYDQISLDDIDFYLNNRADRENYLAMMPLLRTLKKWRLSEIENEKHFVGMVIQQITSTTLKKPIADLEAKVWSAVEWWKFKNQFKRPIDKDDAKALRMIQGKIISDNKLKNSTTLH